jgi:hypothetical protein
MKWFSIACTGLLLGSLVALGPAWAQDNGDDYKDLLEKLRQEAAAKAQYRKQAAERYYQSAKKRYDERRYEDAEKALQSALAANPNHAQARALLDTVRRILGKTVAGERDILKNEAILKRVDVGVAVADLRETVDDAKELLNEDKYDGALEKLEAAQSSAKVLARYVNVSRELSEINALMDRAAAAKKKAAEAARRREREQALELARREEKRLKDLQEQRVERLFSDAKELYQDTRYLLAAKKAEEILKIEPRNAEVQAFRDKCYQMQRAEDVRWYERTKKIETDTTWRQVRKLAIPFSQVDPIYPDDWDEKRKRTAGVQIEQESPEEAKWKRELQAKLQEPVSFDFIATPLEDVVSFLRNLKNVNIVVDKQAVADRGGQLDVTLRLNDVKFEDALEWILRLVNLKYTLENGAIYVSTQEKIGESQKTVTRYYDVTDLTVEIRNFKPNVKAISNADLDVDDMQDIFAEEGGEDEAKQDTFTGESLVEFIKEVIAPGTWKEVAGGGIGGF